MERSRLLRRRTGTPVDSTARPEAVLEPIVEGERLRLGELLVAAGRLQTRDLHNALVAQAASGKRLGELLIDLGLVGDDEVRAAVATQQRPAAIDLRRERPAPEALALLPGALARSLGVLPLRIADEVLTVAVGQPMADAVPTALRALPVRAVHLHSASLADVHEAINQWYKALDGIDAVVREFAPVIPAERLASKALQADGNDAPVVDVVNRLVMQALRDRASDIHLEPTPEHVRVRFRIDGALTEVVRLPAGIGPALVSRIKVMADMNIVEQRRPQDGQFQAKVDGRELDVRVSTTTTIFGEKAVLRILDKGRSLFDLVDLGMPDDIKAEYDAAVRSPHGMIVVAGPTGSGKTTTLYATLTQIAKPELNVTTIEDPVEYVFPSINQIEISAQSGVTFATGLRSILRQDPDIILVGEIRDSETARIAVQSALTGHLVLSSLHATDAASALFRLLDMGIEPYLLASSVTAVVAQRLLRRTCRACAAPYTPPPQELAYFERHGGNAARGFVRGTGCAYCANTGYRDRIGIYEVLAVDDEIRHLVVHGSTPQELRELAAKQGLRTLRDEAFRLVSTDVTTIAEAMRTVYTL